MRSPVAIPESAIWVPRESNDLGFMARRQFFGTPRSSPTGTIVLQLSLIRVGARIWRRLIGIGGWAGMSSLGESIDRKASLEAQAKRGCALVAIPCGAQGCGLLGLRGGRLPGSHPARLERERVLELRDRFQHLSLLRLGHVYHRRDPGAAAGDAVDRARPGQGRLRSSPRAIRRVEPPCCRRSSGGESCWHCSLATWRSKRGPWLLMRGCSRDGGTR